MSKIEAGRANFEPEQIELGDILSTRCGWWRSALREKKLELKTEIDARSGCRPTGA